MSAIVQAGFAGQSSESDVGKQALIDMVAQIKQQYRQDERGSE
jgi:hypothetical protein